MVVFKSKSVSSPSTAYPVYFAINPINKQSLQVMDIGANMASTGLSIWRANKSIAFNSTLSCSQDHLYTNTKKLI